MKPILFIFFIVMLSALSCSSSRQLTGQKIQQGIEGIVQIVKGDRMPSPDLPLAAPAGYATTIYIHQLTAASQLRKADKTGWYTSIPTPLVATVNTDSTGHFAVELPPGQYSIFVQYENANYIPYFSGTEWTALFEIKENAPTQLEIIVRGSSNIQ